MTCRRSVVRSHPRRPNFSMRDEQEIVPARSHKPNEVGASPTPATIFYVLDHDRTPVVIPWRARRFFQCGGRSSIGLECWTVNPEVAGSNPVDHPTTHCAENAPDPGKRVALATREERWPLRRHGLVAQRQCIGLKNQGRWSDSTSSHHFFTVGCSKALCA